MIRLALRTIRVRKVAFLASFVALLLGAVLVMACGSLMETGIRSSVPPSRLAATSVVVTGSSDHPEPVALPAADVAKTATAVRGEATVVGDVSFPAFVRAAAGAGTTSFVGGTTSGHGWSSARLGPYAVRDGAAPQRSGEIALDAHTAARARLAPGERATVTLAGRSVRAVVAGVVSGPAADGGIVFVADHDVARFQPHPGSVDAIAVLGARGSTPGALAAAMSWALPGATVLTGDDRGRAEYIGVADSSETLIVIAAVFGGIAVLVEVFIVASVLGLSMQQRAREHALLRAVGAQPRQLRRLVLGETFVVALAAMVLAYLPSKAVGRFLLDKMGSDDVVDSAIRFHQGWVPVAAGAGVALLSAMLAAYVAARPAVRTRPVEALADSALRTSWLSWPRGLFAAVFLAGAGALTLVTAIVMEGPVASSTAGPMAMLWAIGIALLGPGVVRLVFALVRVVLRAFTGMPGGIAMRSATRRRVQLAGAVMPIMLATGLGVALIYMQTTQHAVGEQVQTRDIVASTAVESEVGGLRPDVVAAVRRTPGVAAATAVVSSSGYLDGPEVDDKGKRDVWPIQGVTPEGADRTVGIEITTGSLDDLGRDGIVVPTSVARDDHHRLGDTMTVYLGDDTEITSRVVGTYDASPGYEQLYLPAAVVAAHTRTGLATQVLVRKASGRSDAAVTAALTRTLRDVPGARVIGGDALHENVVEQEQTGAWVNYLLVAMITGYAVISLVNSLVVATAARRREFALQRLVGATRGQLMRMASVEGTLVGVSGLLLGAAVAGTVLVSFDVALSGSPWPHGSPWIATAVFGGSFALTMVTTLITTAYVSRARPVEAAEAV